MTEPTITQADYDIAERANVLWGQAINGPHVAVLAAALSRLAADQSKQDEIAQARDYYEGVLDEREAEIERLQARVAELEAGLKPFAAKADKREDYIRERHPNWREPDSAQITHRLGDFRRARQLLNKGDAS